MQNAKILNQQEIKEIIAKHFCVPINNVINSKYSYIVIEKTEEKNVEKD